MKTISRRSEVDFARIFLSPTANALATIFCASGIAIETFGRFLTPFEHHRFFWVLLVPVLLLVLPHSIAASAGSISRKHSPLLWGLLTAGMLAGWATVFMCRGSNSSYEAAPAVFAMVFFPTALTAILGAGFARPRPS